MSAERERGHSQVAVAESHDQGLTCDPVAGAVAGLAPQGFFRVKR